MTTDAPCRPTLEDAVEAFDFFMSGDFMGKIVVRY